tara:strand:- start:488 stop:994 length:507 start_codon:yes stop_codon:yes gene_type:complete
MSIENDKIFRENVINKFNEMFKKKTSNNIEKGIYNFTIKQAKKLIIVRKWENKYFVNIYVNRWRSLYLNFKNNKLLVEKIKNKELSVKELSEMRHQELCPEKWKKLIDAKIKRDKNLTSVNLSAATDEFKCYRCKKSKCTYYQLQTRSADEPMTTFITCLVCGNRWKC